MVENGLYKIKDQYYVDFPHDMHISQQRLASIGKSPVATGDTLFS